MTVTLVGRSDVDVVLVAVRPHGVVARGVRDGRVPEGVLRVEVAGVHGVVRTAHPGSVAAAGERSVTDYSAEVGAGAGTPCSRSKRARSSASTFA